MAMTYLWPAPIGLSALFDSLRFRSRRTHLLLYALFTGFVDALTVGGIVPRQVDFVAAFILTLVLFGPAHIAIAWFIDFVVQRIVGLSRRLVETPSGANASPRLTLLSWLVGYGILCASIGFPFAYRAWAISVQQSHGREFADQDWENGRVKVFGPREQLQLGNVRVESDYDRTTGFERVRRRASPFAAAYSHRIAELVRERGDPPKSLRGHFVTPETLVGRLDAPGMTEVTIFPHEVTPSIVIFKKGTITRWGSTIQFDRGSGQTGITSQGGSPGGVSSAGGNDPLAIATQAFGLLTRGAGPSATYVMLDESDPGFLYVRYGNNWIGRFSSDGRLLEEATR
jgi:hypothetical protein